MAKYLVTVHAMRPMVTMVEIEAESDSVAVAKAKSDFRNGLLRQWADDLENCHGCELSYTTVDAIEAGE